MSLPGDTTAAGMAAHFAAVRAADEARAADLLPVVLTAYAALDRYTGPLVLDLAIDDADDPGARMAALLAVFRAERRTLTGSMPVEYQGQTYGVLYLDEMPTTTTRQH